MTDEEGRFKALPPIQDDVFRLILDPEAGVLQEYVNLLDDLGSALRRVDEDLAGLGSVNPNLAQLVRGSVEGLYGAFANDLASEQDRVLLRLLSFFNAFVILRTLDLQLRSTKER